MKKIIALTLTAILFPMFGNSETLPPVSVYFEQHRSQLITFEELKSCVEMRESVREMHEIKLRGMMKIKGGRK